VAELTQAYAEFVRGARGGEHTAHAFDGAFARAS
jgi:hypothetical protein